MPRDKGCEKLHHRRPQTAVGFKECFEEQGQTHEIATTGIVKMSAMSARNHFMSIFFRPRLLCRNAKCKKQCRKHPMGRKHLDPNTRIKQHRAVKLDVSKTSEGESER